MIRSEDIVEIGRFQKPHALKGELNALLDIDDDYAADGNPLVVDIDGIFVPFFAESVRPKGTEACLLKLKGVDSQEETRPLVNKTIYAVREKLREYFDGDVEMEAASDFAGYAVRDIQLGDLGVIDYVDDSTANVLFVCTGSGGKTFYIPVADEFIEDIDRDRKEVVVSLPEGLLDLQD